VQTYARGPAAAVWEVGDPAEHGWAWYSAATGLLVAVLFVLTGVVAAQGGPAGIVQRICVIVGWSWIALLAIRLMSKVSVQVGGAGNY
jgi:hypothetical protein